MNGMKRKTLQLNFFRKMLDMVFFGVRADAIQKESLSWMLLKKDLKASANEYFFKS